MLGDKTLLQYVLDEELQGFITNNSITYESIPDMLDLSDGSLVFEVNSASMAFQTMIKRDKLQEFANLGCQDTGRYMHQLGQKIIKLDINKPFEFALRTVYATYKQITSAFAGVLFITDQGGIVNPLHPIVALELINKKPTIKKILLFTYKNLNQIKERYAGADSEIYREKCKTDISSLVQIYQSKIKTRGIKISTNDYNSQTKVINQTYNISKYPGESFDKEYYLVTHQMLTFGTFVPYYGTSLISMNGGRTTGFHISPFKSCNINAHNSIQGSSVCTGGTPNNTIKGLRTLHHANLSSPYERYCMTTASLPYAEECINYSFNIFKAANLIPKD